MYRDKEVIQIVAHDLSMGIGYEGDLLFRISDDLKAFRKHTLGHSLIAGRKTAASLPVLSGRIVTVASRKTGMQWALEEAYRNAELLGQNCIFIIGGGELYSETLSITDKIYVTHVMEQHPNVDTYMPNYKESFTRTLNGVFQNSKEGYEYKFETWVANPK